MDRLRTTFQWKSDGLDAAGLQTRIGASALTLGGLLKHLAFVEDYIFTTKLSGQQVGAPWDFTEWDSEDWPFTSAADDTPSRSTRSGRARSAGRGRGLGAALADGGLGQLGDVATPDGHHASLRRLVCDLIEEYGRHTGHADLLREAVDGLVGEDLRPAGSHRPAKHAGAAGRSVRPQGGPVVHRPAWAARSCRCPGGGWDA